MDLNLEKLGLMQNDWVAEWHQNEPKEFESGFLGLVGQQHLQNFNLWHKEDIARMPDVDNSVIADVKRAIDKFNQRRNDLIESLDDFILTQLGQDKITQNQDSPLNSETPGSMIDRCSIMSLKLYHMTEEANRKDADQTHREKAQEKANIITTQRNDLLNCLLELYTEIKAGTRHFKIYRQFKMYNDPSLNPKIYMSSKG